jgi:general L-amino acid transport system permease protein
MADSTLPAGPTTTPLWRDERFLRIAGQVIFLAALALLIRFLARNMLANLNQQGMSLGFGFLRLTSGFDIGEHLISFTRSDTYLRALLVGLLNTIQVSVLGILFATLLGVIMGVARLSANFLVQFMARAFIEFMRNVPLLVLLIFLYRAVFIQLPRVREAIQLPGPVLLTNRGVAIPWGTPTAAYPLYLGFLAAGVVAAVAVAVLLVRQGKRTGRQPLVFLWSPLAFLVLAVLGWLLLPEPPLLPNPPSVQGLRLAGGLQLSPEFMTLLSGLVLYTSAFIADVVRSGIQAVSSGQTEAARSLGLTGFQTMRLVIFPQALRVIIPPLTSQYLNLTKNSSLAVAIGYPELFHVSGTINNQSGRVIEVIALVMAIYLAISLLTSAFMNWYNQRVRLVER